MLSANALMRLHVGTLFRLDSEGDLLTKSGSDGKPASRFFVGSTPEGSESWFRADLASDLREDLAALVATSPAGFTVEANSEFAVPFLERLEKAEPVRKTWMGPAFSFPNGLLPSDNAVRVTAENAAILSPHLEAWAEDVREGIPVVAYLEEGEAVSVCCSVATSHRAHEAGVETHPDFRGRGLAAKVVAGWARDVQALGLFPLYSTSWENRASRSVAQKLGLIQYGVTFHVT